MVTNLYHLCDSYCLAGNKMQKQRSEDEELNECFYHVSVTAQLGDSARHMKSYEQTYNTGCRYANVGDWTSAVEALTSVSADTTAREEVVGIIKVQSGYVTQRQDRDKEAQSIYDQNIYDNKKRIKAATVESLETKLKSSQRSAIARNNALLLTAQVDLCKQLLSTLDFQDEECWGPDQGGQAPGGCQHSGHQ